MSKKKKSALLIESDSDDSDSGKDLEEVTGYAILQNLFEVDIWPVTGQIVTSRQPVQ